MGLLEVDLFLDIWWFLYSLKMVGDGIGENKKQLKSDTFAFPGFYVYDKNGMEGFLGKMDFIVRLLL